VTAAIAQRWIVVLDRKASIGERIAFYRKQRGLTQQGLAMRLNRSPSWLRKIEQGSRPLTDVNVIAQVAQNLGVKVADLLGKPIFPEPVGDRREPGPVVPQLRRVLLHYDTIHGFAEDFGDDPPRPVEELAPVPSPLPSRSMIPCWSRPAPATFSNCCSPKATSAT